MALSDVSNQPYKIKVYTNPIPNTGYKDDDQSLETPLIKFQVNVKVKFVSDKPAAGIFKSNIHIDHDSLHEFEHNLIDGQVTRDFLSNMFADTRIIPFSLMENLYGEKRPYYKEWIPLASTDDVVTSMLDICRGMVNNSGRTKKMLLPVFITKEVNVSHDEYLAVKKAYQARQTLQRAQDMVRRQAQEGWNNIGPYEWELMDNAIREAGLGNSVRDALNVARVRAIRESAAQRVRFVPAASTSIEALEKVLYCRKGGTQEKCAVCLEDLLLGSQVTCMPCSHLFHGNCIVPWLKTNHVCPICRFRLPTK